jgi:hypothetical protein
MDTLKIIVGNTVDFIVDVDGVSDSPTEAKIEIYNSKVYPDGLTDKIAEFTPVSISDGAIAFLFDSDQMASAPTVKYGRFYLNDGGKKINAYFKLKFTY